MGHISTCGQMFAQWSVLPQYWQGTHCCPVVQLGILLLALSLSLVTNKDFSFAPFVCTLVQRIFCSITVMSLLRPTSLELDALLLDSISVLSCDAVNYIWGTKPPGWGFWGASFCFDLLYWYVNEIINWLSNKLDTILYGLSLLSISL